MAKKQVECSFCGRSKPDTSLLIAGVDAHICDKCIEQAHGIVLEEYKQHSKNSNAEIELKKPKEIDCPQKVRHYLGVFLWKEKSDMIMHLNLNA